MPLIARLIFALALALPAAAQAHSFKKGDLDVIHPWTRVTPGGVNAGSGYLKIRNNGKEADRMTGATFDGTEAVEVHEMTMDGDVMKMRQIKDGVAIKPGETVEFKPGGMHLMLLGLKKPIVEGADLKGTVTFEKAGKVDVEFLVKPLGDTGAPSTTPAPAAEHKH
jgi:periplasmic copper chaperone A